MQRQNVNTSAAFGLEEASVDQMELYKSLRSSLAEVQLNDEQRNALSALVSDFEIEPRLGERIVSVKDLIEELEER